MPDDVSDAEVVLPNLTPICAIGASAGGVSALQELFRRLPDSLGLAYVVILHLAPDHPSFLQQILGVCTNMQVLQVQDSPFIKPNRIYVIAPDTELVIDGDSVMARPFTEPRGRRAPIDMFFRSVAKARGDGIAMVLSGTGSDGAQGLRAIKEAGGVIMVQDPVEAEFGSMPDSAISTGTVDFVAPVAQLASRVQEVAHSKDAVRSLDLTEAASDLRRIIAFLRNHTGHDFSSYKRATVLRRVTRRMQVCRLESLTAYAELVQSSPEEAKELFSDLLISVTMFFRDARAFEALERHAIRPILDEHQDMRRKDGIRAWVVGCATGEEAFSLAILMLEAARKRSMTVSIQIFATDLDENALATARAGRYPRTIETTVAEDLLDRYFIDEGSHYLVRKEVRETVVFALHSVLKDPPFLRLDLISCRNLLIYFERNMHQQLYSLFHYGLRDGRCLFLGSAETADTSADLFAPLDREARIYVARPHTTHRLPLLPQYPTPDRLMLHRHLTAGAAEQGHVVVGHHATALEQAGPPSALVDMNQNLLHLSPTAGRFILHSAGPPTMLLPAMVRPELRLDLKLALERALNERKATLTYPVVVTFDGEQRRIGLQVTPVMPSGRVATQVLVFFLDGDVVAQDEMVEQDTEARPTDIRRLFAELKATQEALVVSRSGHDVTIQDLRATNQELQSTNEEYRSTAEELETSREELQSINEELHTVNAELKNKLEHLSTAHGDLQNLTMLTEVGTLFLDVELRIKMFTPPAIEVFNITKADIGRSIGDFTNRLKVEDLLGEAKAVVRDCLPLEREVESSAGRHYVMRIRPYRTMEDRVEGVVLTFVDITARVKIEFALGRSEQQFRALVRASSQVLYRMNADWTEMRDLFGGGFLSSIDAPIPSWLDRYVPAEDRSRVQDAIQRAIDTRSMFDLQHRVVREDGTVGWTHSRAIPILDTNGEIVEWFGSADDVTPQRRVQGALHESEERLRVLVEGVPQHVWRAEKSGVWTWSSPQWHRYTGLSEAESRGTGWQAAVHPDDRDAVAAAWREAADTRVFDVECRIRNMDQLKYRWFRGRSTALFDARGQVAEWLGTFTDVDDLRTLQGRQEVLLAELQHRVRNIMAVIGSVITRTAENSTSVNDYAARLRGRLEALARTQVVLTRRAGIGVGLEAMVRDEVLSQTIQLGQVHIEGPAVELSAKAAEVLTLALHELTTNAVKHGALSHPGGSVDVRWEAVDQDGEMRLMLRWTETGLPARPGGERQKGFGTELITQRVPYELNGTGELEIGSNGVDAVITFPLRTGNSILQTDAGSVRATQWGVA